MSGYRQAGFKVQKDFQEAQTLKVNGTPGFFIGLTTSGNTIKGTYIEGAQADRGIPPDYKSASQPNGST